MNERGLWELFCKTGLPAAYLAVAGQRQEDGKHRDEPANTAFQPKIQQV